MVGETVPNQLTQFGPASFLLNGSRHWQWHCLFMFVLLREGCPMESVVLVREPQAGGKHSISHVPLS